MKKSVSYADFGDSRSRDRDLEAVKSRKTAIFVSKIIKSRIAQKRLNVER